MIMTANVDFNDLLVPTDAVVSQDYVFDDCYLVFLYCSGALRVVAAGGPPGRADKVLAGACWSPSVPQDDLICEECWR